MIDVSLIRRLAVHRGHPVVTSIYLDVDGRGAPRPSDIAPRQAALFREARRQAAERGEPVAAAVERDLQQADSWLAEHLERSSTRGVAFFSCAAQGWAQVVPLPVPVRDQVVLGPTPDVAQLAEAAAAVPAALVVTVDGHRSRLLRVHGGAAAMSDGPTNPPERRADTDVELGGFDRQHEQHEHDHYHRVAAAVVRELTGDPHLWLVLAGPHRSVKAVEADLPPTLRVRLAGTVSSPVPDGSDETVEQALTLVRDAQHRQQLAVVDDVRGRAEQGRGAVAGLVPTLRALGDGAVTALVVAPGLSVGGGRCPSCGLLTAAVGPCPRCGAQTEALAAVVDLAVSEAIAAHVPVEFCPSPELDGLGGIGALVRS